MAETPAPEGARSGWGDFTCPDRVFVDWKTLMPDNEPEQGQTRVYDDPARTRSECGHRGFFQKISELPADTQIRVERHQEAVFEMPDTEPDGQQISAGPEPLLQAGRVARRKQGE